MCGRLADWLHRRLVLCGVSVSVGFYVRLKQASPPVWNHGATVAVNMNVSCSPWSHIRAHHRLLHLSGRFISLQSWQHAVTTWTHNITQVSLNQLVENKSGKKNKAHSQGCQWSIWHFGNGRVFEDIKRHCKGKSYDYLFISETSAMFGTVCGSRCFTSAPWQALRPGKRWHLFFSNASKFRVHDLK